MKTVVDWMARAGAALVVLGLLAGCGSAPTAQSQSGTVGDTRPNEAGALDQELLKQVDAKIAASKAQGSDVTSAQNLRDSAVKLAQSGNYAEANGNLKIAAELVAVLRPLDSEPTAVAAPAIAGAPVPAATGDEQGSMVLNATFDAPNALDSWQRIGPKIPTGTPVWEIQDGALVQRGVDSVDAVDEQTGLVTGDPNWKDVTVRASVMGRDTRELGLIVRQQNESYYRFRAAVIGTGTSQGNYTLEKVIDGKVTELAAFDGAELTAEVWHTLAITARGTKLTCYVDGKAIGSAEDSTLSAGRAGVSTLAMSGAYFKNVQVIGG